MINSEHSFLEAWNNYQPPKIEHEYRVYYDAVSGAVTATSVELRDEPHIVVDRETYNSVIHAECCVINGQLAPRTNDIYYRPRLTLADDGEYATLPNAVQFLTTQQTDNVDKWTVKYDKNN